MEAPVTDSRAPLSADLDDERYLIRSRSEILSVLNALAKSGNLVTVSSSNASDFILSSVIAVDARANRILVDVGRDANSNARILASPEVDVATDIDRIKVHFRCGPLAAVSYGAGHALALPVPDRLMRLQRRDFFRVTLPVTRPLTCELAGNPELRARKLRGRALDISCGGIGVQFERETVEFSVGEVIDGLVMHIPSIGIVEARVEIRKVLSTQSPAGVPLTRIGCRFIDMPPPTVSRIQRYIHQFELSRKTR